MAKIPVRKPQNTRGCEVCIHRKDDFWKDTVDPNIIRCYCKARHIEVDAEVMSKGDCDFLEVNPLYKQVKEENRYGL